MTPPPVPLILNVMAPCAAVAAAVSVKVLVVVPAGIVAGANNLNQYQLDGEYVISKLLAPSESIQLVNFPANPSTEPSFPNFAALGAAGQLTAAATAAQQTPQGQARLALAMAFLNVSPWGGATIPSIYDYVGQEQGQFDVFEAGEGLNQVYGLEHKRDVPGPQV